MVVNPAGPVILLPLYVVQKHSSRQLAIVVVRPECESDVPEPLAMLWPFSGVVVSAPLTRTICASMYPPPELVNV